jgi:hypothetical protein
MEVVDSIVTTECHGSEGDWELGNSHGVCIFFPSTGSSFYSESNYDFAVGATWPGDSVASL